MTTTPTMRTGLVAFVDVLGFLNRVKRAARERREQEELERIHQALAEADQLSDNQYPFWDVRFFTDNLVLVHPELAANLDAAQVLTALAYYQLAMCQHGYFVRGGVSLGPAFADKRIVFGLPLVQSYEIEHSIARFPRIVAHDSVIEMIKQFDSQLGQPGMSTFNILLRRDLSDGRYFVDYLRCVAHRPLMAASLSKITRREANDRIVSMLDGHKRAIAQAFHRDGRNPKLYPKFEWVRRYHNQACQEIQDGARSIVSDLSSCMIDETEPPSIKSRLREASKQIASITTSLFRDVRSIVSLT